MDRYRMPEWFAREAARLGQQGAALAAERKNRTPPVRIKKVPGRPLNESLAVARIAGDKTYEGSMHPVCGTTTRYTSGGGCVHCARQKQQEMRDALANEKRSAAVDALGEADPAFIALANKIMDPDSRLPDTDEFADLMGDVPLTGPASSAKEPWD